MAGTDYRQCDVCGRKTFYDAHLPYDFSLPPLNDGSPHLDGVGQWSVLCVECAKRYETVVVRRDRKSRHRVRANAV